MNHLKHNYLTDFITTKQSQGRYSFTIQELRSIFNVSDRALKQALQRLVVKGRICSVRRNFYIIIPPEYLGQRIVPPALFIDALMRFIRKPYYTGLLSAAGFYGASHQQPQEFFVVTVKPALRRIAVRGIVINFIIRKKIAAGFIQQRATETGYLQVSGPVLTALDCVISIERIGGIGRIAEVIADIAPSFEKRELRKLVHADVPLPAVQRLGTLLDYHEETREYGDALFKTVSGHTLRRILLTPAGKKAEGPLNRWNVVENTVIESEE